jgi:hypothetical protein
VGKINQQSGVSLTAPAPGQSLPRSQQQPVNHQFHPKQPQKPKKDRICSCKQTGHRLRNCCKADSDGFMSGCPICDIMAHDIDDCTAKDTRAKDRLIYHLEKRNSRPLFRSSVDIRDMDGFWKSGWRSWTPNFAKANVDYYKTHEHMQRTRDEVFIPDPAWDYPEAIPAASLAYQYGKFGVGFSGQSSTTPAFSHMAQVSNQNTPTITPARTATKREPVDERASVLEDGPAELSRPMKRGRESEFREGPRKRPRADNNSRSFADKNVNEFPVHR